MMIPIKSYIIRDIKYLKNIDIENLQLIIDMVRVAIKKNKNIYIAGNGGSAATAIHFATDLKLKHKELSVMSLNENQALLTALSNDYEYGEVFKKQLFGNIALGDILIAISASGNSENLIRAIKYANFANATTIGLLGFDGGKMSTLCDFCIIINTPIGQYEEVEDLHLILTHIISKETQNDY